MEKRIQTPKNLVHFVFLDAGDTLVHLKKSPGEIYGRILMDNQIIDIDIEIDVQSKAFGRAWKAMNSKENPDYKDKFSFHKDGLYGWWRELIRIYVQSMGIKAEISSSILDKIITEFEKAEIWQIEPTFYELQKFLSKNQIGLGLISNWDHRLRNLLTNLDLIDYFYPIIISGEFGYEKPSPKIFAEAERITSLKPSQMIYVGDKLNLDYYPPLQLGWNSYLCQKRNRTLPFGDIQIIENLSDLIQLF